MTGDANDASRRNIGPNLNAHIHDAALRRRPLPPSSFIGNDSNFAVVEKCQSSSNYQFATGIEPVDRDEGPSAQYTVASYFPLAGRGRPFTTAAGANRPLRSPFRSRLDPSLSLSRRSGSADRGDEMAELFGRGASCAKADYDDGGSGVRWRKGWRRENFISAYGNPVEI